jgi:hypothetical protein
MKTPKREQKMVKQPNQTNKPPKGDYSTSISFDEFTKYLTGYSSYKQLEDAMNGGNHGEP